MNTQVQEEKDIGFERESLLAVLCEVRKDAIEAMGDSGSAVAVTAINQVIAGTLGAVEAMQDMRPDFKFAGIASELTKTLYGDVNT